jgi:hypothetical protein
METGYLSDRGCISKPKVSPDVIQCMHVLVFLANVLQVFIW